MFVKKMDFAKKNDKLVSLGVLILTVIFVFIFTRGFFLNFAKTSPVIAGFTKFFFLASIGDFIGSRLKNNYWKIPKKIILKAIVWGLIGSVIVLVFSIFNNGIIHLQDLGILPFKDILFVTAFLTSLFMNVIFAPTMMTFHRVSDTYLDGSGSIENAVKSIDWVRFYKIVLLRTIPFFWIPMHTITFLLPTEYQVMFAAILGIALGLLLSLFKK